MDLSIGKFRTVRDNSVFTCAKCKRTFKINKEWPDEDAERELSRTYPNVSVAECNVICDDCYRGMKHKLN